MVNASALTEGWEAMRNLLAGIAILPVLAGCGLPPALTIASTLADGISYIASGKSVSDHALSAVTTQDCAMLRILDNGEICVEYADEESTVLLASGPAPQRWSDTEVESGSSVAATGATDRGTAIAASPVLQPVRYADAVPAIKPMTPQPATNLRERDPATITVLGSYRDQSNAEREILRLAALQPRIERSRTSDALLFRVVSDLPVAQARAAGVVDAWPLSVDAPLQVASIIR